MSRKHSTRQTREGQHASSPSSHRQPTRESTATVAHPLQQLQQTHGNQAVQRLTAQRVQPKLEVGPPNDRYEREADRVAKRLLRMPEQATGETARNQSNRSYQTEGGSMTPSATQPRLQRTASKRSGQPAVDSKLEQHLSSGRGDPLPEPIQSTFGRRFGQDFSDVRVHHTQRAAELNRSLDARAFTHGQNIYFGSGNYSPETAAGRELLAHELAHVVQQRGTATNRLQRQQSAAAPTRPRSLSESLDLTQLTASEIEREVRLIRQWLVAHPERREETAHLRSVLPALEQRLMDTGARRTEEGQTSRTEDEITWGRGREIRSTGIVSDSEGVNLRDVPSTGDESTVIRRLPFNTRLFVDRAHNDWYQVTLDTGEFGYAAAAYVKTNLPEPEATLHEIQQGESAIGIAEQYYKPHAQQWGQDLRFYVNVLEYVNRGEGPRGIYREGDDWEDTKTRAGYLIWIPSVSFAKRLRGTVSSGSITYEAWETAKSAVVAVGRFIAGGAAFIAGILHGALESLWDVLVGLKDLAVMVWDVMKSLIKGSIISDARALWDAIKNLDPEELIEGWINDFVARWNHESLLKRWNFRGWIVGYAIAEILMMIFSGGAATVAKWGGRMGKAAKLLKTLPMVSRLADKAEAAGKRLPQNVRDALRKGAKVDERPRVSSAADEATSGTQATRAGAEAAEDVGETGARTVRDAPTAPRQRSLNDLIRDDGSGFVDETLQDAYERYLAKMAKEGKRPKSPRRWAFHTRRGPRERLEELLGPDFTRRGTRRRADPTPFMNDVARKVRNPNHPLHPITVPRTSPEGITFELERTWQYTRAGPRPGRFAGGTRETVQAGHKEPFSSGREQIFMLEDADLNVSGARRTISKQYVEIGLEWKDGRMGDDLVRVELETARKLEREGKLLMPTVQLTEGGEVIERTLRVADLPVH